MNDTITSIPSTISLPLTRLDYAKKYSWLLLTLALFSTYLPFVTVSSLGQTMLTQNGFRLVFGGPTMVLNHTTGVMEERSLDKVPEAVWPVALLAVAFLTSIFRRKILFAISGITGASGLIAFLMLKSHLENEVATKGEMIAFRYGFWLCVALLEAGVVLQFMLFDKSRQRKP